MDGSLSEQTAGETEEVESSKRPEITSKLVRMIRTIKEEPMGIDPHQLGKSWKASWRRVWS